MSKKDKVIELYGVDIVQAAKDALKEFFKRSIIYDESSFNVIGVQLDDPFLAIVLQSAHDQKVYIGMSKRYRHKRGDRFNLNTGLFIAIQRAYDLFMNEKPVSVS